MAEITDRDDRALLADGGRADGPPRLRGRDGELRRVRLLIDAARGGRSGVLAIVGEAGIGKTAVLEAAAAMATANGVTLLRARGTEGEAELPFSGLHELFGSALPAAMLPSQLRDVFAGRPRTGADRFSVYVATLDAFAIAAGDGPVVALVDDVQWLDDASAQALRFVGRRLGHEGVALLLAGRVPPDPLGRVGIPSLRLAGLDMSEVASHPWCEFQGGRGS
jgi:predicted ATPase